MIEMRLISAADTFALRKNMMWPDLPLAKQGVDGDETAQHVGAFRDGVLVGVGSLFPDGPDTFRLRKLAVDQALQGQGVGRQILAYAQDLLRA